MQNLAKYQDNNWFGWGTIALAGGAGLYFAMQHEPYIPYPYILAVCLCAITAWGRVPKILRIITTFLFGFVYAFIFTNQINTPQINSTMRNTEIVGQVYKTDIANNKKRIYIKTDDNMRVRLTVGDDITVPNTGDTIKATATLFRPAGTYAPETFDYARWAYFNNLTATGYISDCVITRPARGFNINSWRNKIHEQANSYLVDALVLGYKNAVPDTDSKIWTTTGVGHVWSISGFHMTLVGGWIFAIFFLIFRAIPYVTRRIPARIPAIICAWIGLGIYLFISGIDVATVRAFLMTTLVFMAFILGRRAFSMRNVCLAFCIIFLLNPHYVMQPGFQLSFSAVFGLVWFWGERPFVKRSFIQKVLHAIYATIITSGIATVFTAPFVIAHFYSMPIYGLIGNLILLPIFSFAIMPCVMIGAIGIDVGVKWAHGIYDWALTIATQISDLPMATVTMPHTPNSAMVCFILGLATIIFIKNAKYKINHIIGWAIICVGVGIVALQSKPIFMSTFDNTVVAFRNDKDNLIFNTTRSANHYFAFDTFLQLNGQPTDSTRHKQKCKRGVCEFTNGTIKIVQVSRFIPLMKNLNNWCNDKSITYIVSHLKIDAPNCNHKILSGGIIIYDNGQIKRTKYGRRWHNQHG